MRKIFNTVISCFARDKVNYDIFLKNFSYALLSVVDISKVSELMVKTFYDFFELKSVSLYLYNKNKNAYLPAYTLGKRPDRSVFYNDEDFMNYLKSSTESVLFKNDIPKRFLTFDASAVSLFIPLAFRGDMLGILMLGDKRRNADYTEYDCSSIAKVVPLIAIALNNAILFKEQEEIRFLMAQKNKMDAIIALSSGINHEINNPLSIISMKCQNFIRKYNKGLFKNKDEVIANALDTIEVSLRNTNRAHSITKRLANFARPQRGMINLEPVELKQAVEDAVGLIGRKQFEGDNVNILVDIPENIPYVYADKVYFQQVLHNIIMNAYHAVKDGGEIRITAEEDGKNKVVVSISDNGHGISRENIGKIWEPFFTTKPTAPSGENKITGSGLGLSLVKQYIESSGGEVGVESEVGVGTKFTFSMIKVSKKYYGAENTYSG